MSGSETSLAHPRLFLLRFACIQLNCGLRASVVRHPEWAAALGSTCPIAFRGAHVRRRSHHLRRQRLCPRWVSCLAVGSTAVQTCKASCRGSVYRLLWSDTIQFSLVSKCDGTTLPYDALPLHVPPQCSLALMISLLLYQSFSHDIHFLRVISPFGVIIILVEAVVTSMRSS
jgi:hypothetical protein